VQIFFRIALWSAENFQESSSNYGGYFSTSLSAKLLRGATDSFPYRVLGHSGEREFPLWGLAVITSAADRKEALLLPKKQGKIRDIGFTGQKSPDIHLKMLQTAFAHQFTFDAVQCHEPANQRGHHRVRIACHS